MRPPFTCASLGSVVALLVAVLGGSAAAAPGPVGTVTGVVVPPATVEAPPSQHLGFLPLVENPIVELRQFDPLPECFVFLEGGPAGGPTEGTVETVTWQLESNSFNPPVFPILSGANVVIANVGRETHLLIAPGHEDLLPKDPIGPGAERALTIPGQNEAIRIVSRATPHLEGRVVPLASRYFSRLDRNGRFKIENVPVGRWTLKVWYRDGWAAFPGKAVEVPAKDISVDLTNEALSGKPAQPAP